MQTHIDGNYYLSSDKYNWILQERYQQSKRKNKTTGEMEEVSDGEYRFRDVGYYPNLSQLSEKVATLKVKAESVESLNALIQAIERLVDEIHAKIEQVS